MNLLKIHRCIISQESKKGTPIWIKRREAVGKCESKGKEGFKNMRQTRDWENQYITQKNRYPMHTPYGAYAFPFWIKETPDQLFLIHVQCFILNHKITA